MTATPPPPDDVSPAGRRRHRHREGRAGWTRARHPAAWLPARLQSVVAPPPEPPQRAGRLFVALPPGLALPDRRKLDAACGVHP